MGGIAPLRVGAIPGRKKQSERPCSLLPPGNRARLPNGAGVYRRPLGTKLAGEETTHFYRPGSGGPRTMIARPMPETTRPMENPTRTADRRNQPAEGSRQ